MAGPFRSVTLLCVTGGGGRGMSDWSLVGYEQSTASHHKNKPQRIHSSLKKIRKLARSSLSLASSVKCYPLYTSASATTSAEKWNHFHVHSSQVGQFLQDGKNDQTLSKKNIFCRFTVTKRFDFFNFSQLFWRDFVRCILKIVLFWS